MIPNCQRIIYVSKLTPNTACCLQYLLYFGKISGFFLFLKVFHSFKYSRTPVKLKIYYFYDQPSSTGEKENNDLFLCTGFKFSFSSETVIPRQWESEHGGRWTLVKPGAGVRREM